MRKAIIPLMLGVLLVASSAAQQKKSDLEHSGLKGKVKTVKIEESKFSNKSAKPVEGKRVHIETQSYGENGMIVKSVRPEDERLNTYFYSYETNGNRIEFVRTAHSSSRIKTEFTYDAAGNRLEEVQSGSEGLVNKTVFVYDSTGRPTEKSIYNKQGLFARRTYTYGADVNPKEEAEYDSKGGLVGKQSYSYEPDSTGNWIKRITFAHGTSNGKKYIEPATATYRTITYY